MRSWLWICLPFRCELFLSRSKYVEARRVLAPTTNNSALSQSHCHHICIGSQWGARGWKLYKPGEGGWVLAVAVCSPPLTELSL